ncbi:hypothetical protein FMM68_12500 [Lachnospiraceae bacterium MD329]|nr:hypothetical protein [Lachnospiraceae bacterium MD329]
MVDTMIIYNCFSTMDDYYKTMGRISKFMKDNHLNNLHRGITYGGADFGFEEIRFYARQDVGFYAVYIKLRPKLLICKNNYINTMYPSDIVFVEKEFKTKAKQLGLLNDDIMSYKVKRIDYAVDVILPHEQITKYIQLFKKSNIPDNLLNDKTMRYFEADNNFYLMGEKYNVNFYNRYDTLSIKQKSKKKAYSYIERTKGKFRFEIQLTEINTNKLKRQGLITKNSVQYFFNPDTAERIILRYYDKIIGRGDYVSYFKALSKLNSENAKDILSRIRASGSVYNAKKQYISEHSDKRKAEKQFSSLLSYIRDRNINPVTLESGENKMLNPRNLICEYFDNKNKMYLTRRYNSEEEN